MPTNKQPINTVADLIRFLGQTYPLDGEIDIQSVEDGDGPLVFTATLCEPKPEPETTNGYNTSDFNNIITDPSSWPHFMQLFNTAARIVGEAEGNGYVLVPNEDAVFDQTTDIEKLRAAIHLISPGSIDEGDYLPWLSAEQHKRLEEVAAEIIAWGNGENIRDIAYGKAEAETMTPRERLDQLKDDHAWRCERLGFDPQTGLTIKN